MEFIFHNYENEILSINTYFLKNGKNISYKFIKVIDGESTIVEEGPYLKPITRTFHNGGDYIIQFINRSKKEHFLEFYSSQTRKNHNIFFDKEVNDLFDSVFDGLAESHKESIRIFSLKKSIIDLAHRWKFRVGFLLFISPFYILIAYMKSFYLRNLFALKKSGI